MLCSLFQFLFPLFILYYPFVFTFAEIYAIKKNSKSEPSLLPFSSSQRQFSLLSFYPRFTFTITIVSYIREHCAIGFVLFFILIVRFVIFVQHLIVHFVTFSDLIFAFLCAYRHIPNLSEIRKFDTPKSPRALRALFF